MELLVHIGYFVGSENTWKDLGPEVKKFTVQQVGQMFKASSCSVVVVNVFAKKSDGSKEKTVNYSWGGVGNVDSLRENLEE